MPKTKTKPQVSEITKSHKGWRTTTL